MPCFFSYLLKVFKALNGSKAWDPTVQRLLRGLREQLRRQLLEVGAETQRGVLFGRLKRSQEETWHGQSFRGHGCFAFEGQ